MTLEEERRTENGERREDPRRTVRLPFAFGERVYHRAKSDRMAGIVTGFVVRAHETMVVVTWGDDLRDGTHYFFELTTEFEPFTEDFPNADH